MTDSCQAAEPLAVSIIERVRGLASIIISILPIYLLLHHTNLIGSHFG